MLERFQKEPLEIEARHFVLGQELEAQLPQRVHCKHRHCRVGVRVRVVVATATASLLRRAAATPAGPTSYKSEVLGQQSPDRRPHQPTSHGHIAICDFHLI